MELSKPLYTLREVSALTGKSVKTLRGYIETGEMAARMLNGRWHVTAAEIKRVFT